MAAPPDPARAARDFCGRVCSVIRWKAARKPIAAELTAHLEDHAQALQVRGVPPEAAAKQAVAAMGDPYELGRALDQAHPPTLPRLSRILALLGALALLAGIVIGIRDDSGLPALHGVFPQAPELPHGSGQILALEGSATGGGTLGGYTFASSGRAGLAYVSWEYDGVREEQYQLQVPVTATASRPWLPTPEIYRAYGTWTDDAGGSGWLYVSSGEDYLLGSSGWLRITDPTPGARVFTLTVTAGGEESVFTVTLPEEVPPL